MVPVVPVLMEVSENVSFLLLWVMVFCILFLDWVVAGVVLECFFWIELLLTDFLNFFRKSSVFSCCRWWFSVFCSRIEVLLVEFLHFLSWICYSWWTFCIFFLNVLFLVDFLNSSGMFYQGLLTAQWRCRLRCRGPKSSARKCWLPLQSGSQKNDGELGQWHLGRQ